MNSTTTYILRSKTDRQRRYRMYTQFIVDVTPRGVIAMVATFNHKRGDWSGLRLVNPSVIGPTVARWVMEPGANTASIGYSHHEVYA